ncbi:MAG TPA: peptide MFS transporter [Myxococcota bacterium]|nr:peptide MFS transporter [Myxococcota bacterium]HOD00678.1 peptide MFS transporter [Myxococcota bacterium]HOH75842.1 peptide MFS transporter [Myxococcota bacterium]HPV03262.1 peptide MFS transporter [Myxococcota bacterium]
MTEASMFKEHPRGLIVAFFANMGERFGFYTMMAILVLFLQARFGLDSDKSGAIYSVFYFLIYALALVGGIIADKTRNYKRTILAGIIIMFLGYVLMAIPGTGLPIALTGLFTIALGNGMFKGNLQAVVGQMYDDPKYNHLRDSAFSLFYMGINIGAVFAPNAARSVRTWYLGTQGLKYDADLPALCHQFVAGNTDNASRLQEIASLVSGGQVSDLGAFARNYLEVFSTGYNMAFGIAAGAMLISLATFVIFKKFLPDPKAKARPGEAGEAMPWDAEKKRLMALGLVFLVVIFFWMSFHQNGLTMTFFARDYTAKSVDPLSYLVFDIKGLLLIAAMIAGVVVAIQKGTVVRRLVGSGMAVAGAVLIWFLYGSYKPENLLEPEVFQQFNPYFVVFLTPVVVGLFALLRARNREPSTPKKIGIGMLLAATGFTLLMLASFGLPSAAELGGGPSPDRVSPNWLITTYFILTVAELFLSPMGLSFVSKVAPPRFQGLMQGGWLGATALGNQLLVVGSLMWARFDVWTVWAVFVVCCLISATVIFSMSGWLNRMTGAGSPKAQ